MNDRTKEQRVNWCWYSVRTNSLHEPASPSFPNIIQRLFMRLFGLVAIIL